MNTVFLLLENHFFKTPDGRIWCDRVVSYEFLKRYLQSFDKIILCGRCSNISKKDAEGKKLISGEGISFVELPDFAGAVGTLKSLFGVKRIIRKNLKNTDCAILRGPSPLSLMVYKIFKKSRKPFAVEFVMAADRLFDSDGLPYRIINNVLVKRARKMCLAANGVSYVTEETLQREYPCRKDAFTANYSSIDLDSSFFYQQEWDVKNPPKCFNIVHTGYMDSNRKGQDILIEAARQMVDAGQTNFKITFIGDGKMRSVFEKMASDYNLKEYIEFLGAINDKNMIRDILIKNHLFVFPSRSEGLPRSIIEAMAVGLVCVAPATDGIPELVDKEYSVAKNNAANYAKKIISVMDDWGGMINESKRNNKKAKDFKKTVLDERRKRFYDELKRISNCPNDKKITLVISQLSGGGAERVTCNLANYLDKNGYHVDIITMAESKDAYKTNSGVKEICLLQDSERRNAIFNNTLRRKRLKQYVIDHKDVSCYVSMLSLPSFLITSLEKYITGRIIVSERCNPATHTFINKIMMKYAVKRCDGLVVQTKEISDWYRNIQNKTVIPNAINEDVKLLERTNIEKKFVAVGRLEKQKNYPMMIRAFAVFSEDHPEYKLEIYGQGSQKKILEKIIEENGLAGKIILMGHVKDISEKIVDATCFLMTSDYEGISNALIEAMCIGLPCISTNSDGGGAKELIANGENGFIIKKNDVDGLVMKMKLIVSDTEVTNRLSNNAKKICRELNSEKIYAKWLFCIRNTGRNAA